MILGVPGHGGSGVFDAGTKLMFIIADLSGFCFCTQISFAAPQWFFRRRCRRVEAIGSGSLRQFLNQFRLGGSRIDFILVGDEP